MLRRTQSLWVAAYMDTKCSDHAMATTPHRIRAGKPSLSVIGSANDGHVWPTGAAAVSRWVQAKVASQARNNRLRTTTPRYAASAGVLHRNHNRTGIERGQYRRETIDPLASCTDRKNNG